MTFGLSIVAEEWLDQALCAQTDPEIFFPDKGGSTRAPKSICDRCPVTRECLTYALDHDERFGIWGGVSERDRRKLQRDGYRPSIAIPTAREDHPVSPTPPAYVTEITDLLTATEKHPDPVVRKVRKILTQSAVALQEALAAADTETPAEEPTPVAPPAAAPAVTPPPAPGPNAHLSVRQRLIILGVDQAAVRKWAAAHGVPFNAQGTIRTAVLDAYEQAHPTKEGTAA